MNSGKLTEAIYGWMSSQRLNKGAAVIVDAVIHGLGPVRRHSRATVVDELNAMVHEGVLTISGGKYKLTAEGELFLYPGTPKQIVAAVMDDLINYMLREEPSRTFKLQEYRAEISQRLNPRQEDVVIEAIQALVNERYWKSSGVDAYTVID